MSEKATELAFDLGAVVDPVCRANGVELVLTQWVHQHGAVILRVMIDRPSSSGASQVTLADCQVVSRALSVALDVHEDVIPGRYQLEVTSPGLDRPLVRPADFRRFCGKRVKIKTARPVEGRRAFTGTLLGLAGEGVSDDNQARVEVDGTEFAIPLSEILKAHLVVEL